MRQSCFERPTRAHMSLTASAMTMMSKVRVSQVNTQPECLFDGVLAKVLVSQTEVSSSMYNVVFHAEDQIPCIRSVI